MYNIKIWHQSFWGSCFRTFGPNYKTFEDATVAAYHAIHLFNDIFVVDSGEILIEE